jgi:transposase
MLSNIASYPQVRVRSATNPQGLPRHRLPLMPSQNARRHVPCPPLAHARRSHLAPLPHEPCAAFVGIDWADATHALCLPAAGTTTREARSLDPTPAAIDAWVCPWRQRCGGHPVAGCLELNKEPMVSALRTDEVLVLCPVHPLTLARYREAFTPSRAQADATDAARQLELLLNHRDQLTPLQPQSPQRRALAQLVASRRRRVGAQGRMTNRLTSALKHYFPHVLRWLEAKETGICCDFWRRGPTLKAVPLARRATLAAFVRDHHVRSAAVSPQRLQAIKAAPPRTTDAGILTPKALWGQALVAQLRVTFQAMADFDHAIAQQAQPHPDFPLCQARPGAGSVFAPRLLVALGAQRERSPSAAERQQYAGIAPVTERRGKHAWVHGRLQCPPFLRQTCVEGAAASIRHACWAQVDDQQQRAKGQRHQAAVRALALQWLRLLSRCWQARTPYDESVSLQALTSRGSSLLHTLAK